ncbi:uncharacterized protein [Haliotis cracherodii]|uniref:uncharacterized protein n=1 Tax=Haliotis cracherodii TaxID=6455 RepID=UPI0039ED68D9
MDIEDTDIYQALLDNDLQGLKKLLREQNVNLRGRDGQSYLHAAVGQGAQSDLIKQLLGHIDISFRDENADTALDMACLYEKTHIQEMILRHVGFLALGKDVRPLEHLLLQGWDAWPVDVDCIQEVKLDIAKFFKQLPDFMVKVDRVHHSIQRNSLKDLQHVLTHHQLAAACDRTGQPPLQKAVIFQRNVIVEYLVEEYPTTLTVTDHTGRTALHYAACIPDGYLYSVLREAGADDQVPDLHDLSPQFYKDNMDVLKIQDVQRHVRVLQKRQRINNCFSLTVMMAAKDTNSLPDSVRVVRSPMIRRNSSPACSPSSTTKPSRNRDLMAKWRTLVNIIPIQSLFKSSRKHQNSDVFEDTDLYEAIIMSDQKEVTHLLQSNINTQLRSLEGWSYLHLAVAHSSHGVIIRLLLGHIDITVRDADGLTALDLAVVSSAPHDIIRELQKYILRPLISGEITLVRTLAVNGWCAWPHEMLDTTFTSELPQESKDFLYAVNDIQDTIAAFHRSVIVSDISRIHQHFTNEKTEITNVQLLESCDQTGLPPLHKAVIFRCSKAVTLLLNTFIHAIDICDHMQRTALHYAACVDDNGQMYTTLQDLGAEPTIPDLWGFTAVEYHQMPHLINIENIRENILKLVSIPPPSQSLLWTFHHRDFMMEESKLFQAIQSDNTEDVINLLNTDEDISIRTNDGKTLLHIAAEGNANREILNALVAKVDASVRDVNSQSFVDILRAKETAENVDSLVKMWMTTMVEKGSTEALQALVLSGWDTWALTPQEAREKSEDMGEFFDKLEEVQDKVTRLHEAICDGRTRDVKNLLDRKLLVKAADKSGLLPLQKAVVFQQDEIAKFIVSEFKDSLNLTDNMGRTALHYAAGCSDSGNLYQTLKEAGADDTLKDLTGKTAADYQTDPKEVLAETVKSRLLLVLGTPPQTDSGQSAQTADQSTSAAPQTPELATEEPDQITTPLKSDKSQPIRMYISSDIYEKKDVPAPSTVDGKYVSYNLGSALTLALAEIAERRPWDPIEYLAHWLYKYRENIDFNKKQEQLMKEIREEEADLEAEEQQLARRKEEQMRLQEEEEARRIQEEEDERKKKEQEELQRKAKEAALLQKPQLPTVTEEGEEDTMNKDRDEDGQTELHKLAAQQGADLNALLNMGYSLADRDANNRTARDVAEENGITENTESLDSYVTNLLEQENLDSLQQLLLDGYDQLTDVIDRVSTDGLPEDVTDFVKAMPDFNEKISLVFKAVHSGVLREVIQALERKKLATAKDKYGRSPLHIAVLSQHMDIIKHILSNFPISVRCRDNLNRTPLHYAMAISDEVAELLQESGADAQAKDVKQRTPSYYKDEKADILALKDTLESGESSQEADDTEKGETTE